MFINYQFFSGEIYVHFILIVVHFGRNLHAPFISYLRRHGDLVMFTFGRAHRRTRIELNTFGRSVHRVELDPSYVFEVQDEMRTGRGGHIIFYCEKKM
jgi:hypothetical protein